MWKFALRGRAGDAGATGEQGEQGVQGEQGEQGVPGDFNYTDRGDIDSPDMDLGTIVTNGAWQALNLSSIIGAGHRLVLISVFAVAETYGNMIEFRTAGNENDANTARFMTMVADGEQVADLWVWSNASGVINYRCADTTWDTVEFTIRGWVEPTP